MILRNKYVYMHIFSLSGGKRNTFIEIGSGQRAPIEEVGITGEVNKQSKNKRSYEEAGVGSVPAENMLGVFLVVAIWVFVCFPFELEGK